MGLAGHGGWLTLPNRPYPRIAAVGTDYQASGQASLTIRGAHDNRGRIARDEPNHLDWAADFRPDLAARLIRLCCISG